MGDYDDRLEHLRDAEGEDNTDPDAPDAPGCFPAPTTCPVEHAIEVMETHSPLDAAIAGGMKGPLGPLYALTDEERF